MQPDNPFASQIIFALKTSADEREPCSRNYVINGDIHYCIVYRGNRTHFLLVYHQHFYSKFFANIMTTLLTWVSTKPYERINDQYDLLNSLKDVQKYIKACIYYQMKIDPLSKPSGYL